MCMRCTSASDVMIEAEKPFRATPNAVHKLQQVLRTIAEDDGNMVAKEIWHEEDIQRYVLSIIGSARGSSDFRLPVLSDLALEQATKARNRDASISVANSWLNRLEELLGAVEFLKSSLDSRVSDFRRRKPSRTFTDIPDELIAYIFDILSPNLSELTELSLVCKRLRRIAISEPGLWARQYIRPYTPHHILDMIVERSGTRKFAIDVRSPLESCNTYSKHGDRWSELSLVDFTTDEFYLFQKLTPSSKLTSLRTLSLRGYLPQEETDIYKFNQDWLPPSLESLYCVFTVPKGLAPSSLTTCFFEFASEINFRGVVAVLSSTPFLEMLNICITESDLEIDENTSITLPSLQK